MSRQIGETPTRIFNPRSGEEQLVTVLGKGELLGGYAPCRKAPRSATAIPAETVILVLLPADRLENTVRSNPVPAMAIVRDLITRLLATEERAQKAEARTDLDPAI